MRENRELPEGARQPEADGELAFERLAKGQSACVG